MVRRKGEIDRWTEFQIKMELKYKNNMPYVTIPIQNIITTWHATKNEDNSLHWLLENIGEPNKMWTAQSHSDDSDYALFWFNLDEDAIAFKLRWA